MWEWSDVWKWVHCAAQKVNSILVLHQEDGGAEADLNRNPAWPDLREVWTDAGLSENCRGGGPSCKGVYNVSLCKPGPFINSKSWRFTPQGEFEVIKQLVGSTAGAGEAKRSKHRQVGFQHHKRSSLQHLIMILSILYFYTNIWYYDLCNILLFRKMDIIIDKCAPPPKGTGIQNLRSAKSVSPNPLLEVRRGTCLGQPGSIILLLNTCNGLTGAMIKAFGVSICKSPTSFKSFQ